MLVGFRGLGVGLLGLEQTPNPGSLVDSLALE